MEFKMSQISISPEQLQTIGNGTLAYVKKIEAAAAAILIGQPIQLTPGQELFCLYNANGSPISISQSVAAAVGSAMEHELVAGLVH
jgi:hypothetical protein